MRTSKVVSFWVKREGENRLRVVLLFLFLFFLLSVFIADFFVYGVNYNSATMEPSISSGNLILVTPLGAPLAHGKIRQKLSSLVDLNRGDIVVIEPETKPRLSLFYRFLNRLVGFFTFQNVFPFSTSSLTSESRNFRRIVAMPGDTIFMKDFVLHIKPQNQPHFYTEFELAAKSYDVQITKIPSDKISKIGISSDFEEIVLDKNEYFLLADVRNDSVDSRLWGPIHASRISGKAFLRYFPLSKLVRL